jgi:sugar phosphate isomerase/epimerase
MEEGPAMTRKDFLQTVAGAAASACLAGVSEASSAPKPKIKRGVSLYSYQEEFYAHAMTLENCIAEVASMGAEGIELIAEEMVPNYPDPPESWVREWHRLMDKYRTKPVCLDTFVDVTWGGHRQMTREEALNNLVVQLELSNRLGFKIMRPMTGPVTVPTPEIFSEAIPYAEKYDVRITPEIHTPIPLKGKFIDSYMDLIARTKTKHVGLTLDLGIFHKRPPRVTTARMMRDGMFTQQMVDFIEKAGADGMPEEKARAEFKKLAGKNEMVVNYFEFVWLWTHMPNPKDLLTLMPHIFNIHGKFYEMTEDLVEYSMPYDEVIPVLIEGGYDGYIVSEYEGQRQIQDITEVDSCEQVRRQHVMLRRLLGEMSS